MAETPQTYVSVSKLQSVNYHVQFRHAGLTTAIFSCLCFSFVYALKRLSANYDYDTIPPKGKSKMSDVQRTDSQKQTYCHNGWYLVEESVSNMSLVVRKSAFGVSDQVPLKPGCTATENG